MKRNLTTLSALSVCISMALNASASAAAGPALPAPSAPTELSCPTGELTPEQQASLPEACKKALEQGDLAKWVAENGTVLTAAGATALAATIAMVAASGGGGSGGPGPEPEPGRDWSGWDVGNRLEGDNQEHRLEGDVSAGRGQIGNLIIGDGTKNELIGDQNASDGGTGTVVEGDDTSTVIEGDTVAKGEGSTGQLIIGDNAEVSRPGDADVSDGATGTRVEGDNASVVVEGDTQVGSGGTGTEIIGDSGRVENSGGTVVTGPGSTGTRIEGDNAEVVNNGDTSVSDGGTGTEIIGDNARLEENGNTTVTGPGSTGTRIVGDNAVVNMAGEMTVGQGGTGVSITGKNADVGLDGVLRVSGGAAGLLIDGEGATVRNGGDIYASGRGDADDEGNRLASRGVDVTSDDVRFTNTGNVYVTDKGIGVSLAGDRFNVLLDGNIIVDAATTDTTDRRKFSHGVQVSGRDGLLTIAGNVEVNHLRMTGTGTHPSAAGVSITGGGNRVSVDGAVSVSYEGTQLTRPGSNTMAGVKITGDGNQLRVSGGLNLFHKTEASSNTSENYYGYRHGLRVEGDSNTVTLGGDSRLHIDGNRHIYGDGGYYLTYAWIWGKNNRLILERDFNLDVTLTGPEVLVGDTGAWYKTFRISGEGSVLENNGALQTVRGSTELLHADDGAALINNGRLAFKPQKEATEASGSALMSLYGAGYAVNRAGGVLDVLSVQDAAARGSGRGTGHTDNLTSVMGMVSGANTGALLNEGTINVSGQNAFGMSVGTNAQALNSGVITLNAMSNDLDGDGNLLRETGLWGVATDWQRGAGMLAMRDGSTVLNTGEIRVHNAGMGMAAGGTGTAINRGVISLSADNASADALYAMAAVGNGTAINDAAGVININTDKGFAFYKAGNGIIINRGTVNFNGAPVDDSHDNWGAAVSPVDADFTTTSLSASGESKTIGSANGNQLWFYAPQVSNGGGLQALTDVRFDKVLHNSGTFTSSATVTAGSLQNDGTLRTGTLTARSAGGSLVNNGIISASVGGAPAIRNFAVWNEKGATITNSASAVATGGRVNALIHNASGDGFGLVNYGDIIATKGYSALVTAYTASANHNWHRNMAGGRIIGDNPLGPLIQLGATQSFYNGGEVSVKGSNAVAIALTSQWDTAVVNEGVINVGTQEGKADGTNGTGLVGIQGGGAASRIYNNASGVINVWADSSHAFAGTGTFVNNGTVNLLCDTGCDIFKGFASGSDGDDYAAPGAGDKPVIVNPGASGGAGVLTVAGYTVGTNADGSAGTLSGRHLLLEDVKVDQGFTEGTASKSVLLNNVFKGETVRGEENVSSNSVVWSAKAQKNAQGNVDVLMTKNDYAAIATDGAVSNLAGALDKGYTNNALFKSLNVGTAAALNGALKQISGAQANSLNREARVLGQRFSMLAETAPVTTATGLSFNVVAKGDRRAEMENKVTYDMMALRQQFDTGVGAVSATYGMARLTGSGGNASTRAGDNGLTGGYSQFFGLDHTLPFGDTYSWNNSLRADLHQLDSRRNIQFEGVNRVASASGKQQHLEFRSEGVKKMDIAPGLSVAPFAGMKMRHHVTDGYTESGAAEFNLSVNRYSETAVDAVAGMRLTYAGSNGWAAHATLEAGPNLSLNQSQRKASLQGLQGHQFSVNDGKKAGSLNSKAMAGVNYQTETVSFGMNAFQWQEDGAADKGLMLNVTRHF